MNKVLLSGILISSWASLAINDSFTNSQKFITSSLSTAKLAQTKSSAITTLALDSDGDGVSDDNDLDDDNDGILDVDECGSSAVNPSKLTFASLSDNIFLNPDPTASNYNTSWENPAWKPDPQGVRVNNILAGVDAVITFVSGKYTGAAGNPQITTYQSNDLRITANAGTDMVIRFSFYIAGTTTPTTARGILTLYDIDAELVNYNIRREYYTLFNPFKKNSSTLVTSAVAGGVKISQPLSVGEIPNWDAVSPPTAEQVGAAVQIDITNLTFLDLGIEISGSDANRNIFIDGNRFSLGQEYCVDTDGDGIVDKLDLDSDNDGCPDAVEGGKNFAKSDLVKASGTVNGGTSSVNTNLCASGNCVASNGIPLSAGTDGQNIGDSKNANINSQCAPAPEANDDQIKNTNPGSPVTINIITNDVNAVPSTVNLVTPIGGSCQDTDGDGDCDKLTISGEGVWTVNPNGETTFTPEKGFTDDPTPITYTVKGSSGALSAPAKVTIDNIPLVSDDSETGITGQPVTVNAVANDTLGDKVDPTTIQITGTSGIGSPLVVANEGTWSVNKTTGAITFTPEPSFKGNPTPITYTAMDHEGNVSPTPAKVNISYGSLPVSLINFKARATSEGVKLTWQTTSEVDFDRFEVEKSFELGPDFVKVGTVTGGNTYYGYTDVENKRGTTYYRLKMVDMDGSFTYSRIIGIESIDGIELYKVYPNPSNIRKISLKSMGELESYKVYDMLGREIRAKVTGTVGDYEINFDEQVALGIYVISYTVDGRNFSQKFVLTK